MPNPFEVRPYWLINVNPAYIYALGERKRSAEGQRKSLGRQLQMADQALTVMGHSPKVKEVTTRLWKVGRRIQALTQGLAPAVGVAPLKDLEAHLGTSTADDVLVRTLARALYALCHPDREGDPSIFAQVQSAVALKDIGTLQYLTVVLQKEHNLSWRYSEGLDFWTTQYHIWRARQAKLKSSTLWPAVSLYCAGSKEQAVNTLVEILKTRLAHREAELINLLTKHGEQDGKGENQEN